MSKNPGRGSDQFNLRFPDGMRGKIANVAEANGRSMNAEIIKRLQDTLDFDEHVSRHVEAPEPSEDAYGVSFGEHLQSHPTPGIAIKGALDRIFDEVRSLRMSILDVRQYPDGRREVEFAPSDASTDNPPLPDPQSFPKPTEPGYDEALLKQVETIAARYGFDLVKKDAG
ncbi:Arc family DNA-binding protein [Rhizobium laguerreae]|uniref:Arc family DNA-binding protein n=1 Tax=Rhizobium laguerreae TaxID=1076926 RepID=UPI003008151B